ncbi:MAG: MOSC domain-containing protein [Cyclobacteriaceae bacterium]
MESAAEPVMKELLDTIPQKGSVSWIGLRPARNVESEEVDQVEAKPGSGLEGDRFKGGLIGKRQVTLIQEEHLTAVGQLLDKEIDPKLLRRNILVKGINLLALHNRQFKVGDVVLEGTGYCHPCSKMEKALGPGGYNAMRGHGGITAKVIAGGLIKKGDTVQFDVQ